MSRTVLRASDGELPRPTQRSRMKARLGVHAESGSYPTVAEASGNFSIVEVAKPDETGRDELTEKKAQVLDRLGLFWILWYCLRPGDIGKWWSRGELNPRPQAITGQFYMRSSLI